MNTDAEKDTQNIDDAFVLHEDRYVQKKLGMKRTYTLLPDGVGVSVKSLFSSQNFKVPYQLIENDKFEKISFSKPFLGTTIGCLVLYLAFGIMDPLGPFPLVVLGLGIISGAFLFLSFHKFIGYYVGEDSLKFFSSTEGLEVFIKMLFERRQEFISENVEEEEDEEPPEDDVEIIDEERSTDIMFVEDDTEVSEDSSVEDESEISDDSELEEETVIDLGEVEDEEDDDDDDDDDDEILEQK